MLYRHQRTVVRRVMTEETARTVRGLLRGVVESGTAESASLATFDVAGKTGTAKRTEHGKLRGGEVHGELRRALSRGRIRSS